MAQEQDQLRKQLIEARQALEKQMQEITGRSNPSGICGNCQNPLSEDDRYCRFCGTARNGGQYTPSNNMGQELYGPPPVRRVRKCTRCGHQWSFYAMLDPEQVCPVCGAQSEIVDSGNR